MGNGRTTSRQPTWPRTVEEMTDLLLAPPIGILALDVSTVRAGFCTGAPDKGSPIGGGSWDLPGANEFVFDRTTGKLFKSVREIARLVRPEWIIVEAYIAPSWESNFHTISALIELTGAVRAAASITGCKFKRISSSTVRSHFIGRGNLPSAKAKLAVQDRCDQLGWSYKDHDHADAIAIWSWGMSTYYREWAPRSTPLFGRATA